jgi:hypothetical protein
MAIFERPSPEFSHKEITKKSVTTNIGKLTSIASHLGIVNVAPRVTTSVAGFYP